ncbi:MAG: hypothetical protein KDC66_19915 [Phaeodactylibacter sp.]|nr:hypothetical protein [Phaeodactylibacter sp.]MCB9273026.1 hypothetical protein [Lewinellaceae bacterium]
MVKSKVVVAFLCLLSIGLNYRCNPDCDSLPGLSISTTENPAGYEVLIRANPPSALQGRKVFFGDMLAEQSRFIDNVGLAVTVPDGLNPGKVEMRIEDPDCQDFVALDFNVTSADFFQDNPDYVFPPLPEIIIPTLPADFPPSIENAWLSPQNLDYCLWFKFVADADGNCTQTLDPLTSFEQSTCGKAGVLYEENQMSGYMDSHGVMHLSVERANGSLEEFEGELINPDDAPEKYLDWNSVGADCLSGLPGDFKKRTHMMLLTSKATGRQLLIYQQAIPDVPFDCL